MSRLVIFAGDWLGFSILPRRLRSLSSGIERHHAALGAVILGAVSLTYQLTYRGLPHHRGGWPD